MRPSCLNLTLLAAASLLAQAGYAQHAPVAPLAPAKVAVQPAASAEALGRPVPPRAAAEAGLAAMPAGNQARPVMPQPLYLANSCIIVGSSLNTINPQSIENIVVYKGEDIPVRWRTATANGVIDLTLKPGVKIRSVSLARLKRRQHLTGPVRFELDGRPLADTSLRIATAAIQELVMGAADNSGAGKVLNIKLVPWNSEPSKHQPGTILIRGVAGR
ncbi:hypothetical protein HHL22_21290 [Hymenobacter sp. RP-2-7]|uniref:Gliding motility-associated protein GldM C-terminal domain-containing protein n=1 Tax=Hymenobacter polaris TaxID=2682546 RepID=A0A7Y0AI06_9BACT|nr:hypothetical protein [Hymenobacter polaris]NML67744.1 hypothetical protein [Hymenobacter polaris]